MDELEISGRRFLSTRRAAKEHKYTSDYVGQLIRSGKVAGQKVGRSWYVDEQSLNAYLSGDTTVEAPVVIKAEPQKEVVQEKPAPTLTEIGEPTKSVGVEEVKVVPAPIREVVPARKTSAEKIIETEVEKDPEEKIFEPVVVTQKIEERHVPIRTTVMNSTEKPMGGLRYVSDDEPALPEVQKKTAVTSIPVKPIQRTEEYGAEYERPAQTKKVTTLAIASVAIAGLAAFSVSTVLSTTLNNTIVVEDGQVANVGYTFK